MIPVPTEIHRDDRAVTVRWTPDHVSVYPARRLRLACPCAECRDETTGALLLDPERMAPDLRPAAIELVGGYGFRVRWSDGHHAGIYPYAYVQQLCECDRCTGAAGGAQHDATV